MRFYQITVERIINKDYIEKNLDKWIVKSLVYEVNYAPNVIGENTSKAGAIVLIK